jgi:hypothetical protein
MKYREIIGEAWEFTQNNKKFLFWYVFPTAVFTTLAGIIYLIYQFYAIKSSPLFENWNKSFSYMAATTVLQVIKDNFSNAIPFIVIAIIIGIVYLLLPSLCEGAIIQLIARKRNNQVLKRREGIKYGMLGFLPIFEYSWIIRTFSFVSLLGNASFVARNLGMDMLKALLPIFIVFLVASILMGLLFTYTEFFIVIDDRKVFESIVKSCVLVVTHLEETILLSILMLIISVRIILQIVFVILIPIIILIPVYLFASSTIPVVGLVVGGVFGLGALYVACYLNSIIQIFAASVWTFTFLELTHEETISARGTHNITAN